MIFVKTNRMYLYISTFERDDGLNENLNQNTYYYLSSVWLVYHLMFTTKFLSQPNWVTNNLFNLFILQN